MSNNSKFCARATFQMAAGNNNSVVNSGVFIPEGALITNAYYFDSSTISLGYTGAAAAFVAAVAISGTNAPFDEGPHGTLVGFAGGAESGDDNQTALVAIQSKAPTLKHTVVDVELTLTVGNERDIAIGLIDLYVEYVMTNKLIPTA